MPHLWSRTRPPLKLNATANPPKTPTWHTTLIPAWCFCYKHRKLTLNPKLMLFSVTQIATKWTWSWKCFHPPMSKQPKRGQRSTPALDYLTVLDPPTPTQSRQSRRVPRCVIGLAPAGHRVADTRAGARVHVLDHDEGMLLQRGHGQVTVIGHVLQEAAVPRPDRVTNLEDPLSVRPDLERRRATSVILHVFFNPLCVSTLSLFTCLVFPYYTGWVGFLNYYFKKRNLHVLTWRERIKRWKMRRVH